MLKPEYIKELKQTNVSESPEKTMERLKAVWKPLSGPKREEILSLSGLVKASIERAYKTGNVSAKILTAVGQVLSLDPYYLAGKSDEQRPFDDALLIQFLTELGYEVGKGDIARLRKAKTEPVAAVPADVTVTEEPGEAESPADAVPVDTSEEAPDMQPSPGQIDYSVVFNELSKLDADAKKKLDGLTEESIVLLLKSLTVQADFSEDKKNRLALIKYLLLV
jgi:hypothetical protein